MVRSLSPDRSADLRSSLSCRLQLHLTTPKSTAYASPPSCAPPASSSCGGRSASRNAPAWRNSERTPAFSHCFLKRRSALSKDSSSFTVTLGMHSHPLCAPLPKSVTRFCLNKSLKNEWLCYASPERLSTVLADRGVCRTLRCLAISASRSDAPIHAQFPPAECRCPPEPPDCETRGLPFR